MVGEKRCQFGGLINHARRRVVSLDFLQGNDVGIADFAYDAPEIDAPVLAGTVLNVVADEPHSLPLFFGPAINSAKSSRVPTSLPRLRPRQSTL